MVIKIEAPDGLTGLFRVRMGDNPTQVELAVIPRRFHNAKGPFDFDESRSCAHIPDA